MFREMNVIAAVAYAAECAAVDPITARPWNDLTDEERNHEVGRVMALMRGEDGGGIVFDATVRAILAGPNGDGHGELALEEVAKLGDYMVNSGLLPREVAFQGGSIVGHALQLLQDHATIKSMFVPLEVATEDEAAAAEKDKADELAAEPFAPEDPAVEDGLEAEGRTLQ